ncbi:MAG: hypothetical protein JWO06_3119 [Bacteroidota bacterium]|nr:hypothetical protein [Bacteroidota bacterium]
MQNDETVEHEGKTFEKISYQDKTVLDRKFINCVFKNCNFSNTIFKDCVFDECTFDGCDLSLMKVKGSLLKRIQVNSSKAIGIQWFDARSPFSINCTDSNISYSSFFGKDIKKAKFIKCVARETDFSECNLTEANFEGTDLAEARFSDTDLSLANFREAKNYNIDVRFNKVRKTKFSLPEALSLLNSFDITLD